MELVHKYDPKVGEYYEREMDSQRETYMRSLSSILSHLSEADPVQGQGKSAELGKVSYSTISHGHYITTGIFD